MSEKSSRTDCLSIESLEVKRNDDGEKRRRGRKAKQSRRESGMEIERDISKKFISLAAHPLDAKKRQYNDVRWRRASINSTFLPGLACFLSSLSFCALGLANTPEIASSLAKGSRSARFSLFLFLLLFLSLFFSPLLHRVAVVVIVLEMRFNYGASWRCSSALMIARILNFDTVPRFLFFFFNS